MIEPGATLGSYRVLKPLGEGGMGVVFLAEHVALERKVALKVLRPELSTDSTAVNRFFYEARAVNKIGNEHIVDITDYGTAPTGESYFVMEYLVGECMAARITRDGAWPLQRALHVAIQIADALAASHTAGIVHRDLKPDNVFLINRAHDPDYVKLLDFGIAKLLGNKTTQAPKTQTGAVLGTPNFMSPEQIRGKVEVDHRTDVYALGVMLYRMVTGQLPFQGNDWVEVLVQHVTAPFPSVRVLKPELPEIFDELVLTATKKERDERFTSMVAFREAMSAMVDPSYGQSTVPGDARSQMTRSEQKKLIPTRQAQAMAATGEIPPTAQNVSLSGLSLPGVEVVEKTRVPSSGSRGPLMMMVAIGLAAAALAVAVTVAVLRRPQPPAVDPNAGTVEVAQGDPPAQPEPTQPETGQPGQGGKAQGEPIEGPADKAKPEPGGQKEGAPVEDPNTGAAGEPAAPEQPVTELPAPATPEPTKKPKGSDGPRMSGGALQRAFNAAFDAKRYSEAAKIASQLARSNPGLGWKLATRAHCKEKSPQAFSAFDRFKRANQRSKDLELNTALLKQYCANSGFRLH